MVLQAVTDSLSSLPPSASISFGATVLLGWGASIGAAGVAKVAKGLDTVLGSADGTLRRLVGPALPMVTVGLAALLPSIGGALGLTDLPPADVIANAPASAVIGIATREAIRKWLVPLVVKQ